MIIHGLEMSTDFPDKPYLAIESKIFNKKDIHPESWEQFSGFWNAVLYRFRSCTEHSDQYNDSIKKAGNSPPQPERYTQEKELFCFFVTGLATIESLCYGVYAIGSIIKPEYFNILPNNLINIKPTETERQFKKAFENHMISISLQKMLTDPIYKEWKIIRNILAHRSLPGRRFHHGGSHDGKTLWIEGIQIDANTTVSRREWLVNTISILFKDAETFTNSHL